jgi:hypothetical protein
MYQGHVVCINLAQATTTWAGVLRPSTPAVSKKKESLGYIFQSLGIEKELIGIAAHHRGEVYGS